ncbi:MAG TPA: MgtC/SapB family protein [Candidatus Magasanikbacteria bacterium]|nr:MgtC/SapB family protein [Candidatus Magasanikbacteria bacterium]
MQFIDQTSIIQSLIYFGQIFLAVLLGGLVGIQREKIGKAAGVRTYALVTGGAALFTLISTVIFPDDPARIAAQIVVGIGFLGAGAILHKDDKISGLTTAAGLWMMAAVGMAVGLQQYLLAFLVSLLVVLVLMFNEEKFLKK